MDSYASSPADYLALFPPSAARDAFWGLPFRIRDPGMIFAWRPGDPRPLCFPSLRGEAWDPEGCTFRPSLAALSPERWVPAALEDTLGLHMILEGASSSWVHHFLPGVPPRAVRSSCETVEPDLRDGDVSFARASFTAHLPSFLLFVLGPEWGGRDILRTALLGWWLLAHLAPENPSPPAELMAYAPPDADFSVTLRQVYPLAWGAPLPQDSPPYLNLDKTVRVYARMSAHYLASPLRADLPAVTPPQWVLAWQRFPGWGGGVPDEVCISTDGSGQEIWRLGLRRVDPVARSMVQVRMGCRRCSPYALASSGPCTQR